MSYITALRRYGAELLPDPALRTLYEAVLNYNTLGPIVFVTPEIGRFSTVGGIGVMVDDLTQVSVYVDFCVYRRFSLT